MADPKKFVGFGEVMLRLETPLHERFVQAKNFQVRFTGAEANVAVSLTNFGIESFVVSKVPDTEIGQACVNFLQAFGIQTDYIYRGGSRLGLFYLESGASQRPSRVIYDRSGSALTEVEPGEIDWQPIMQGKSWFHFSGTCPALAPSVADVAREACAAARQHGLTVSCDLNYRSKLWDRETAQRVMTDLMQFVDVLICNEEDADMVFGIRAQDTNVEQGQLNLEGYADVARQLKERFQFKWIGITLRESVSATINHWSGLLSDGDQCYHSKRYTMHVVDRVGGGDAFAGGLIYGLMTGRSPQDAVEFAAAAACLKHSIHGDFNLVSVDEVERLIGGVASGRIQR
jgi:2-dehydro-3-deoxygluconokinase